MSLVSKIKFIASLIWISLVSTAYVTHLERCCLFGANAPQIFCISSYLSRDTICSLFWTIFSRIIVHHTASEDRDSISLWSKRQECLLPIIKKFKFPRHSVPLLKQNPVSVKAFIWPICITSVGLRGRVTDSYMLMLI